MQYMLWMYSVCCVWRECYHVVVAQILRDEVGVVDVGVNLCGE